MLLGAALRPPLAHPLHVLQHHQRYATADACPSDDDQCVAQRQGTGDQDQATSQRDPREDAIAQSGTCDVGYCARPLSHAMMVTRGKVQHGEGADK